MKMDAVMGKSEVDGFEYFKVGCKMEMGMNEEWGVEKRSVSKV